MRSGRRRHGWTVADAAAEGARPAPGDALPASPDAGPVDGRARRRPRNAADPQEHLLDQQRDHHGSPVGRRFDRRRDVHAQDSLRPGQPPP